MGGIDAKVDNQNELKKEEQKLGAKGYIALMAAIIFFSGVLLSSDSKWAFLDFTKLSGKFGTMTNPETATFMGQGGVGIRHAFLFALSLVPNVMFALGFMELVDHFGGIKAGQILLSPLLRPILGVPGSVSLALITSLQSMDATGAMLREFFENKFITEKEQVISASWAFSGGGTITNYFAVMSGLFPYLVVPIYVPLILIFCLKFVGANLMRLYLKTIK